jgi:nitroreductase
VQPTRFLRGLRAVRRFDPRPVPDDVLADILEIARWTGSAKNAQPWHLVVVTDRETLERLSRLAPFGDHVARAPAAIAVVMSERSRSRSFDEGRITERIMLAAWAHEIGSCIATLFPEEREDEAIVLLGAPAGSGLRTVVSLGYPADHMARSLSSTPYLRGVVPVGRKPVEEVVSFERYGASPPGHRADSLRAPGPP